MKNFKNTLGTILLTTLLITSCKINEDDADYIKTPPTATEFANLKEKALNGHKQEFDFVAENGSASFTSENGVQLTINGNCLTLNGNSVTGTVDVEYIELFDKGSMLTTNKPTMGVMPNGDKAMLISGGEFYISVTQNGEELGINCDFQLIIPTDLTGGADSGMTLWEGTIDGDDNLDWEEEEDANGDGGVFAEGSQYYAFLNQFGWSNVDRFYSDARPKTMIQVAVPEGYDNENSSVYLSYDGEDSGLANLDTFDNGTGLFSEHYGQIPIGLECHVIFITEDNNLWRYAIKTVTIVANDIITFTLDETISDSEAALVTAINGLP